MRFTHLRLLALFAIASATNPTCYALAWNDDFNDGNVLDGDPVTWSQGVGSFFQGTYDASSGDYHLRDAVDGTMVSWVNEVSFTDTYVRTQGALLPGALPAERAGHLGLLGRIDPFFGSAYILFLDAVGELGLQVVLGGSFFENLTAPVQLADLNATSDVVLEMNIVGNEVSGYAWRPGDPKPATPQIAATVTDPNYQLPQGPAGIAFDEFNEVDNDNPSALFRFVAAQDTQFVDAIAGDYNRDGNVDAADFVVWRALDGTSNSRADGDQSGMVGPEDYDVWRANFGRGPASVSAVRSSHAVPEPGCLIIVLAGLVAEGMRSRFVLNIAQRHGVLELFIGSRIKRLVNQLT